MKKPFSGRTRLAIGFAALAMTTGLGISQLMAQSSQPIEVNADTFDCLTDMTAVRGFFVDNLLGDLEATVAAANAPEGAPYPTGSVVQLDRPKS